MSLRRALVLASSFSSLLLLAAGCGSDVRPTPDDGAGGVSSSAASSPTATSTSTASSQGGATTSGDGDGDGDGDGGGDVATVGGGGGDCAPLDDETLQRIELTANGAGKLLGYATAHPGDYVQFEIGTFECCYSFEPVDACATFNFDEERTTASASLDPSSGLVWVADYAPHGSIVTLIADVDDGARFIEASLYVWTEEGNPLVGTYTEVAQLDCDDGTEASPEQVIGELRLGADNRFGVTWSPFEVYVDYWGSYTLDIEAGAIELTVEGGNYVPGDIDPSGTFALEGGELVLRDMWLGTPQGGGAVAQCGHVFE